MAPRISLGLWSWMGAWYGASLVLGLEVGMGLRFKGDQGKVAPSTSTRQVARVVSGSRSRSKAGMNQEPRMKGKGAALVFS